MADSSLTFADARDRYLQAALLKSPHTVEAYRRAIELFIEFLGDRSGSQQLPIQQHSFVLPEQIPLSALSSADNPILSHFVQWLLSPGSGQSGDKRPYKQSTVELRLAGIQNWFQFLRQSGWLPAQFSLLTAKRLVSLERFQRDDHSTPQPPDDIETVIYYYDTQELPAALRKPEIEVDRIRRWELTRLRNRALLHILADTGGRISEVLSLSLADFAEPTDMLLVEVRGKSGHSYSLHLRDSLPAVRTYIHMRGAELHDGVPLLVSHDSRYDGQCMSRVVAWRVVQRAARALGLHDITPHDFRHWRAVRLLQEGYTLDEVQSYLGHRSVETTRIYYAPPPERA